MKIKARFNYKINREKIRVAFNFKSLKKTHNQFLQIDTAFLAVRQRRILFHQFYDSTPLE